MACALRVASIKVMPLAFNQKNGDHYPGGPVGNNMTGFVIYTKPSKTTLRKLVKEINKWFEDNPRRRVCNTDLLEHTKIRKGRVLEDLYAACDYSLPEKQS